MLLIVIVLLPLLLLLSPPAVGEADISKVFPDGCHRVDLSYTRVEAFDADVDLWLPGYTYAYSNRFRVQAVGSFLDVSATDLPGGQDGIGDTFVQLQYDPAGNLTANPFIPDGIGLYGALSLPTGDFDKGLSTGAYIGEVGGGWLIDGVSDVWFAPSAYYQKSFAHEEGALRVHELNAGVGVYWLFPFAAWLGIEPYLGYDFENSEDIFSFRLVMGKTFSNNLSVDLQWGYEDRTERGAQRDDSVLFLGLIYQFGDPPRSR